MDWISMVALSNDERFGRSRFSRREGQDVAGSPQNEWTQDGRIPFRFFASDAGRSYEFVLK